LEVGKNVAAEHPVDLLRELLRVEHGDIQCLDRNGADLQDSGPDEGNDERPPIEKHMRARAGSDDLEAGAPGKSGPHVRRAGVAAEQQHTGSSVHAHGDHHRLARDADRNACRARIRCEPPGREWSDLQAFQRLVDAAVYFGKLADEVFLVPVSDTSVLVHAYSTTVEVIGVLLFARLDGGEDGAVAFLALGRD